MAYKRLKEQKVSEQQERQMIEEIDKKFGGIDLLLNRAAQANPSLAEEGNAAQKETQETVSTLREEHKQTEEIKEKPETFIKQKLLISLPRGGSSNIKQLLRQTKTELKIIQR